MTVAGRHDRVRRAFDRAVQAELDAITLHEAAAVRLEDLAKRLEAATPASRTPLAQQDAQATAVNARSRAQAARDRADAARERLRQEGVDPGTVARGEHPMSIDFSTADEAKHHADDLKADAEDRQRSARQHREMTDKHLARGVNGHGLHQREPGGARPPTQDRSDA